MPDVVISGAASRRFQFRLNWLFVILSMVGFASFAIRQSIQVQVLTEDIARLRSECSEISREKELCQERIGALLGEQCVVVGPSAENPLPESPQIYRLPTFAHPGGPR